MEAPIEADFDVQECELLRDLNEGEDPWYHCREPNIEEQSVIKENSEEIEEPVPKEEGENCCLHSECSTSFCICGICMESDALL